MPTIELIYDGDCPNAGAARDRLREALLQVGTKQDWKEWNRASPGVPDYVRRYGSPTILVGGRDIAEASPGDGSSSCRIYTDRDGKLSGVPPLELIVAALRARTAGRFSWKRIVAVVPSLGASLLPVGVCPACWPAYAGLLGALGLGFLLDSVYFLPVLAGLFALSLASLAYRARSRRGYRPLALGIAGAGVALAGKFIFAMNPVLYSGLGLLVAASVWNAWPRKPTTAGSCPACAVQDATH